DFVVREKRHDIQTSYVVRSSNARAQSCDRNSAGRTSPPPPWRISICSRTSRIAAGRSQILRTRSPTNSARWCEEFRTWAQDEVIERLCPEGLNISGPHDGSGTGVCGRAAIGSKFPHRQVPLRGPERPSGFSGAARAPL